VSNTYTHIHASMHTSMHMNKHTQCWDHKFKQATAILFQIHASSSPCI